MKKSLLLLLLLAPLLCISQEVSEESSLNYYGEKVSSKSLSDLSQIDEGSLIKVQGTVLSSCPKKGCWMQVKVETDTIQVMFKDYSFFVPKQGLENKTAIIEGYAKQDTISVKMLRHYAEDAGKSKSEIEQITKPEFKLSFIANGVIIN